MSATTVSAVPKYRRHKGTGRAFVQLQCRRYYLGKWNTPKSKKRYAAFVAELAVRPPMATPPRLAIPDAGITVSEVCIAYWKLRRATTSRMGNRLAGSSIFA